jgi:hypothetical protein
MTDKPDNKEQNPLAIVSVVAAAAGVGLILIAVVLGDRWKAVEGYAIPAGLLLALLALGTGAFAKQGRFLYRIVGVGLGILCLLCWYLISLGAYL